MSAEDQKFEIRSKDEAEVPILILQQKPNCYVSFHNEKNEKVGTLDFNTDELKFEGNANESARLFINVLKNFWKFDCKKAHEQGHQDKNSD